MALETCSPQVLRFATFEMDVRAGELRKQGKRIKLQDQPFHVLVVLLQRAGDVVSREELHSQIWREDTFVDFDNNLNTAINKLREALGDSAANPRFVETLPRRGYRFIAPVLSPSSVETPLPSQPTGISFRLVGITVGAVLAVAVGGIFFLVHNLRRPAPVRSIAVLPFQNLSGDPTQDYFADGVTDELITDFAKIGSLRVVSRSTIMHYKGSKELLPQIAQELGADVVVEGSVARSQDRVRIRAQLVRGRTDEHIWANSYERSLADVVVLQGEMARDIAHEIQLKLTDEEKLRLTTPHSIAPAAYKDYLKGQSFSDSNPRSAVKYFQKAIQEQPDYAMAYAEMAEAYITLGQPWGSGMAPLQALSQAKAAAGRALELDQSLGEAHLALARVIALHDWNWQLAEKEYRRALELNPQSDRGHFYYAEYLQVMGRSEEGIAQSLETIALDPLNPGSTSEIGYHFYTSRRYDEATKAFQSALKLDPDLLSCHIGLAWVYAEKKMYTQAIAEAKQAVNLSNRNEVALATLGNVLADSGQTEEARKLLEEMQRTSAYRYVSPYLVALVQSAVGEIEQAFESLMRGYDQRDMWMIYLEVDPHMDSLRNDSRFKTLSRRIGLSR